MANKNKAAAAIVNTVAKSNEIKKMDTDDVPELEDVPPPSVVVQKNLKTTASPSLKLRERERSSSEQKESVYSDGDDDIQEVC